MKQICSLGENKLLGNFADKLLLNGGGFPHYLPNSFSAFCVCYRLYAMNPIYESLQNPGKIKASPQPWSVFLPLTVLPSPFPSKKRREDFTRKRQSNFFFHAAVLSARRTLLQTPGNQSLTPQRRNPSHSLRQGRSQWAARGGQQAQTSLPLVRWFSQKADVL